jgi:choline dehydrogenase-like flavoprotein
MESPYVVIGSGPAGVSCAMGLLSAGAQLLMVDAGVDLESSNTDKLVTLAQRPPEEWTGEAVSWLRDGMKAAVEGIPLKLCYGSDYPYRSLDGAPVIEGDGVNTKYSLGKGGLSTVWGSAVMPYRQHDLVGWPITADDLAPHYRAILDFMPVSQQVDALDHDFPAFRATTAMPLSPQAAAVYGRMEKNRAALTEKGVVFGRSRLAVKSGCVRCGLCMYGCPYRLIYSTAETVDDLRSNPNFRYAPGHVVERLEETSDRVLIHTRNRKGDSEIIEANRVFLGAGVLSSTAVMLRSLDAYDAPVTLRESHYFLLPMLHPGGIPNFKRGDVHTLAQLFLELSDPAISPYTVHLQTYTYNDLFEQPIAQKLGPLAAIFPWNAFLSRLFLFQGYLHSSHSPTTEARLERTSSTTILRLRPTENTQTTAILKRLVRKLTGLRSATGLLPLSPLMRQGEPGRGFHTGSSFPMSANPTGFESDLLGRPAGLKRIHLVDSSVLPTIPATTITYTVMANAHRIGTLAAQPENA